MSTILFLVLFFGLLASGMPIFLVLGACAAVLFYVSGQPMVGVAHGCSTLWNVEEVKEVIDATDGSAEAVLRE
jgi:hypothetical protein